MREESASIKVPKILKTEYEKIAHWFGYDNFSDFCKNWIMHGLERIQDIARDKEADEIERRKDKTYIP